ncbi:MAG TPA: IS256 family transposase [Candidatus Moranbacteria bacterium]|nr:IS256 family transposase [Candidatus Moranbacteria bacterium]
MDIEKAVLEKLGRDLEECKTIEDLMGGEGILKVFFGKMIQKMLESEMDNHLGYEKYARIINDKKNSRNGYSKKTLKSNLGEVEIEIPRDRNSEFEPMIIKKHQSAVGNFEEKVLSLYTSGMTTRDISDHIKDIYGFEMSATAISHITDKVNEILIEWQNRTLEKVYVIIYLDALYYKGKVNGKMENRCVYNCLGIDSAGKKDLLGFWIHESEGAHFWLSVLNELKARGVEDILIACVDGLKGFKEAITTVFPKTEVQTCVVHQIRTSLRYVGSKNQKEFASDMKKIYTAPTIEKAELELTLFSEKWRERYAAAVKTWENNWETISTFFKYPPEVRRIIYTTNFIENVHRQLRKVSKNRGAFTSDDALKKLLFLTIRKSLKKWGNIQNWALIFSQLSIIFGDRLKAELN